MKKSTFSTQGKVFTGNVVIDNTLRKVRVSAHHRHSPWSDCPTCLTKYRKARKPRRKRQHEARRRNRRGV